MALHQMMEQLNAINTSIANINQRQEDQDRTLQELRRPDAQLQQQQNNRNGVEDFFKIPDPIKSLPTFEGNKKQLQSWLHTAKSTLLLFNNRVSADLYRMYTTAVTNKIVGKAKDILCLAGNPDDFETIKSTLISALGDRQELSTYKAQLWQLTMTEKMSIHAYYQKSKELIQNIKTLAKQNTRYKNSWEAINLFIDEDGLAAFVAGLKNPYFGHVQAARPKDIEDAYAFLCKFKSQEITANSIVEKPNRNNPRYENHPKGERNDQRNYFKPNSNTQIQNATTIQSKNNQVTPMDIDPSMRSRLTLNKKLINNTELEPTDQEVSEEEGEDVEEVLDGNINFCVTTVSENTT